MDPQPVPTDCRDLSDLTQTLALSVGLLVLTFRHLAARHEGPTPAAPAGPQRRGACHDDHTV